MSKSLKKMWGGRFAGDLDAEMERLSYSLRFDRELFREDIDASLAHARALKTCGVLNGTELKKITRHLKDIRRELESAVSIPRDGHLKDGKPGKDLFSPADEDVHMGIERILTERAGDLGKKLHTGRSRNDQVATDFRLYLRRHTSVILESIGELQRALYFQASAHQKAVLPGYTHLQQGQPIYLSHYLLAFFWALERDRDRFAHFRHTSGKSPLGSGALAGSAFPYDREAIAAQLGFTGITENSIDATAHRDYVLEFLSAASICGNLLSRYAEDFVIWSAKEFGFLRLDDAFSTGSSMMPQKRNPDSMELIRGKAGRLLGNYTAVFTAVKGTPLCYSRDLQEDKEPVFDTVETLEVCLAVMARALSTASFNTGEMRDRLDPSLLATDVADYLVAKKVPFREAHHLVGALVKEAEKLGTDLLRLPESSWKKIPGGVEIRKKLSYEEACERRSLAGGTGSASVKSQLTRAKRLLKKYGLIDR